MADYHLHGKRQAPASLLAVLLVVVLMVTGAARAQRVQIPATTADPFAVGPITQAPSFDPYALGAPPAATPPYNFSSPATVVPSQPFAGATQSFGSPAPFSAGAVPPSGGLFGASTTAEPGRLFSNAPSVGWQRGSYSWQANDGTVATFTKFLQQLSIDYAYLWGDSTDPTDLELNEVDVAATFALPFGGSIEAPLLITPGFAFNFFDGPIATPFEDPGPPLVPRGPDVPGVVYDAYLDASWFPQPLPAFGADLGLRVGVYSDFETVNSDSLRVLGRGLGVIRLTPTLDLLLGIVFLDRIDISLLPAGGFHYRPSDLWDFYAVFPSPRVTRRLQPRGNLLANWFVAGEYGGGSWTAERPGLGDRFDYNDLRVTTGVEWESPSQRRGSLEIGYVFDRELVFASNQPSEAPVDDTFIVRLSVDL